VFSRPDGLQVARQTPGGCIPGASAGASVLPASDSAYARVPHCCQPKTPKTCCRQPSRT